MKPFYIVSALLIGAALGQHSGPAAAATPVVLRAGTVSQLINAINTANVSHQPTEIRVSAGHYEFTSGFNNRVTARAYCLLSTPP
jgi:hypothetical protein